ncbi:LacI family DNA-binding transcriptional regulator [Bifidobacterium aerophilum]|uniref:LacI family DNA-binding transcriptional regulator n=1 Tax=Bifidobacterium aerophilum TaxID=1798155 RepID=A0A6N9Z5W2_9BIFI|nr:LacI family DNA-binding transcriptional regulator [Bifidobacterium aerophilum]NEG89790.1 LacI family DNA-binding transcriptional regulator [Bifidobacterium aerophilum]
MTVKHTGTRQPTSKDVAALAGVSQSTVSFVINGKSVVAEATRRRVEDAMRKLNYQPNAVARTLKTNRTNIIALFAEMNETFDANETTPYIDAIVKLARRHDYDVIINTTHDGSSALKRLAGKSICDAFILMDVRREDERIATAADLNMPVVLVGRPNNARGLDVVDFDAREAARLAVDELADTNHHHVAMVGYEMESDANEFQYANEFFSGARERAEQRGLTFNIVPRLVDGWTGIQRGADQLLQHADDRLGIIVRQPRPTEWLLRTLNERGLVPGRDLSVVSHCSDLSATSFQWPVTNVSTRPQDVAAQAVSILFERLSGKTDAPHCDLIEPTGITRRGTTVVWPE